MKLLRRLLRPATNSHENGLVDRVYGHDTTKTLGRPVDKDGAIIPWYTYPAIEYLEQFDLTSKSIFEWGCGNSSMYFASRAAKVVSVEHDKDWYEQIFPSVRSNQDLKHVSLEGYPSSIKEYSQKFDIIVIDGQRRFDCTKEAFSFLNDDGIIILDNSDWFYVSAELLREKYNLLQVDFHGFGPINDYTWTTSFFFTKNFKFPLKKDRQPVNPSGGLTHDEKEIIKEEDTKFNTQNYSWMQNQFR